MRPAPLRTCQELRVGGSAPAAEALGSWRATEKRIVNGRGFLQFSRIPPRGLRFLLVQMIVRRIACCRVTCWIPMAGVVGLLGCPQLLDDGFSTSGLAQAGAGGVCQDSGCDVSRSGAAGSEADPAGSAGSSAAGGEGGSAAGGTAGSGSAGTAGSAAMGGSAGTAGSAGSAGSAGAGGSPDAGGSAGQGGAAGSGSGLACWTLELTSNSHDTSSNCVGIAGSDNVQTDTGTTFSVSYQNGDPCFVGTIAASGWGAVYNFGFATGSNKWNATTNGVTGFNFVSRGTTPPSSLKVIYKDPSGDDFCRVIVSGDVSVPFSDAPNCTNGTSDTVEATQMDELILAFTPRGGQSYSVNFCLQISALD